MTKRKENIFRKQTGIIAAVLCIMVLFAMSSSQAEAFKKTRAKKVPLKKIEMSVNKVTMNTGAKKTITVKCYPKKAMAKKNVKWKSSNNSIVSVKKGTIRAKKPGKAVISARAGKKSAKCTVVVKSPLRGISLNKKEISINSGDLFTLRVAYTPANTTDSKRVSWSSSAPEIASVSNGVVTAKKGGTAYITARAGKYKATCKVNVNVPLEAITFDRVNFEMEKGEETKLNILYYPEDTTEKKDVIWSSSNPSVVSVDKGTVRARKAGQALITAKVGSCSAVINITVKVSLKSISLNKSEMTLSCGASQTLTVSYQPSDTTDDKTVKWSSSNTSVATVTNGKVYGKAGGTAVITARVGSCTASCTVKVRVPLKSISLDKTDISLNKGGSTNLKVIYNPSNTTDDRTVKWSSSNTSVATVASGKVTAKQTGNATISAKVGGKSASCRLTVKNANTVSADVKVSGQKITVRGTQHAYPGADTFKACLYNNSRCKNYIAANQSTGTMTFTDLNPSQTYYIRIFDSKKGNFETNEYADSAKKYTIKTGKSKYGVFTNKKAIVNRIIKGMKAREKGLTFYYPSSHGESYFEGGSALFCRGGIGCIIVDEKANTNCYDERCKVNGKAYYKYHIDFSYTYSKTRQKKYLSKIYYLKKKLTGSTVKKVRKLSAYLVTKCKYDYSFEKGNGYDALVGGCAVCSGYAEAANVVLRMSGVKCEYVEGRAWSSGKWGDHAWNIVKVGKKWYYCDFCWNSCVKNKTRYLFKGTKDKKFNREHKLDKEYKTPSWNKAHPMSTKNYK